MADSENSVQQTTTTAVTPSIRKRVTIQYDSRYVRKKGGIAKIVEILLSFLGFISIQCTYLALHSTGKWFSTVSMFGVWITGILLFCYLFHFVEKFEKIPWTKFEVLYCTVIALCFLIASCMAAPIESYAFQAAAFFGFCATVVYAIDAYSKYLLLKSGDPAQGDKVSKEIVDNTTTTP